MPDPTPDPVANLLTRSPLSQAQRADLWDVYHESANPDDLAAKIKDLSIPQTVKADLWDLKAKSTAPPPPPVAASPAPAPTWSDRLGLNEPTPPGTPIRAGLKGAAAGAVDLAQGVKAGAMSTLLGAADVGNFINRHTGGVLGVETQIDPAQRAALTASPPTFSGYAGRGVEMIGELAMPADLAVEAVPRTARAAEAFKDVMSAAKNVPVDVSAAGDVALRVQQLAERGGSMPMVVRKFLNRITDPSKPAMVYEEARDFASNISRLSADEYGRLTPVMAREVANLRVAINQANAKAASLAGKGAEYARAMNEYARAMKLRDAIQSAIEGAKRGAPYATAAGAGYWLTRKIQSLLGTD